MPEATAEDQQNLQRASQQAPDYRDRREYLEKMVEENLDDATVGMLRNMTSADFILSNFNDAEIEEIKKLREITYKKIIAAHPSPKTRMQGDARAKVYENGSGLEPLDSNQKVLIDQYIRGSFARLVRSREGFQQEQFGKTISASERRTPDEEGGDGWLPW